MTRPYMVAGVGPYCCNSYQPRKLAAGTNAIYVLSFGKYEDFSVNVLFSICLFNEHPQLFHVFCTLHKRACVSLAQNCCSKCRAEDYATSSS